MITTAALRALPPSFPDIEDTLSRFLESATGGQASADVPTPRPDRFYRVLRTGGDQISPVKEQPTVVVEAWSVDRAQAFDDAATARDLIQAAVGTMELGGHLYRVRGGGLVELPDPSGQFRYTTTLQLEIGRTAR